ncbi:hypothetical protein SAMN04487977_101462 [Treponema bryantii]|uniref:Uncharacterized protein n=1 Tax=Treponema bryantii TaxID=163 RepID=A0A1H9ATC9_9SPIR|nr:hypothetical protein [Treponema bryantii]SEP79970.1 hypothetical protein SAMN04487977_101462 [Treponema bryantii]
MADLSAFATKDNADEGVVIPVKLEGRKLPIAVKVYGGDSDVVQEYENAKLRKFGFGKKDKDGLDDDDVTELLTSIEGALIRIGGVWTYDWDKKDVTDEPIVLNGKTIGCDKKSYTYLLEKIPALKEWVIKTSNERSNFLSEGKEN